jgi:hypothetical protein
VVLLMQALGGRAEVDDVAVVHHRQPKRVACGKRLRQLRIVGALGGVAGMTDTDVALQLFELLLPEHIGNQAIAFAEVKVIVEGGYTGCILAAVLERRQTKYDVVGDVIGAVKTYNSAHGKYLEGSSEQ